jgi:hypothetical protein
MNCYSKEKTKMPESKECKKCGETKPLTDYHKCKKSKHGVRTSCKICLSKYYKEKRKSVPWITSFYNARLRCNSKSHEKYKRYGKRGIKFLMTKDDVKFLWHRDKAYELEIPSIDRIDPNGNYEVDNCQFIELGLNVSKALKGVPKTKQAKDKLSTSMKKSWNGRRKHDTAMEYSRCSCIDER